MQEEPWYNPIVVFLTGMSVPLGSSERMYQEVQVPHEEAVRGLEAFQNEIVAVATGTSSGASGAWPEEYVRAMATFASGDGADYVQGLKDTAGQLADGAHEFGYQIDYTNAMIVGQVVVFLAEWALTLVLAYFNPVQALVEQFALERVFGQFFKLALVRFAISAGLIMSVSVGLAAALDGLTRWVLAQHGETTTQGSQYRKQSLEFGAIQGAFGAFLPFVMEPAAKLFSKFFGPAVSKSIREAIDAAAGPGHVLARTLGKDLGGDLEKVLARDLGTDVGGDLGKDVGGGAGKRFESGVAREADEKPGPPPVVVFSRRFADEVTGMAGALHAGVVDVQARGAFTSGMGELFAQAFGEEGRAAGESWAAAFMKDAGRPGLQKALYGALEKLPAEVAGDRLRVALSRGVVDALGNRWLEKTANMLVVEAPLNALHQNISEGAFNWMTTGKFTTSFATGISGAGGGITSGILHAHALHAANTLKTGSLGTPPPLDIDPSLLNSDKLAGGKAGADGIPGHPPVPDTRTSHPPTEKQDIPLGAPGWTSEQQLAAAQVPADRVTAPPDGRALDGGPRTLVEHIPDTKSAPVGQALVGGGREPAAGTAGLVGGRKNVPQSPQTATTATGTGSRSHPQRPGRVPETALPAHPQAVAVLTAETLAEMVDRVVEAAADRLSDEGAPGVGGLAGHAGAGLEVDPERAAELALCVTVLGDLKQEMHPLAAPITSGHGPKAGGRAWDDAEVGRGGAWEVLAPATAWTPVTDPGDAVDALRVGETAWIRWHRPHGPGHAAAVYRTDEGLFWIEPLAPAGQRVSTEPPGWDATDAHAALTDTGGHPRPSALSSEAGSIARALTDPAPDHRYARALTDPAPDHRYGAPSLTKKLMPWRHQAPGSHPLFRRENLAFLTKEEGQEPTLYFIKGSSSGRIRQQHEQGPTIGERNHKKDYFFDRMEDRNEFYSAARMASNNQYPFTPHAMTGLVFSETPKPGALHVEVYYKKAGSGHISALHASGERTVTDLTGYDDERVADIYRNVRREEDRTRKQVTAQGLGADTTPGLPTDSGQESVPSVSSGVTASLLGVPALKETVEAEHPDAGAGAGADALMVRGSGEMDTDRWIPFRRTTAERGRLVTDDAFAFTLDKNKLPTGVYRPGSSGERTQVGYAWTWYQGASPADDMFHVVRRIHLKPAKDKDGNATVTAEQVAAVQANHQPALDQDVNTYRHRLPIEQPDKITGPQWPGPVLRVDVEFVDNPNAAHLVVELHPGLPTPQAPMNQTRWYTDASPSAHVHETIHGLGVWNDQHGPHVLLTPGGRQTQTPTDGTSSLMGPITNTGGPYTLTTDHLRQIADIFTPHNHTSTRHPREEPATGQLRRASLGHPSDLGPAVDYNLVHEDDRTRSIVAESGPRETVWRFSEDDPYDVFEEGFTARDTSQVIRIREWPGNRDAQFVATTRDPDLKYGNRRYRYQIDAAVNFDPTGIDVNATLGQKSTYPEEREVAFTRRIDAQAVVSVYDYFYRRTGTYAEGRIIWEPGDTSPEAHRARARRQADIAPAVNYVQDDDTTLAGSETCNTSETADAMTLVENGNGTAPSASKSTGRLPRTREEITAWLKNMRLEQEREKLFDPDRKFRNDAHAYPAGESSTGHHPPARGQITGKVNGKPKTVPDEHAPDVLVPDGHGAVTGPVMARSPARNQAHGSGDSPASREDVAHGLLGSTATPHPAPQSGPSASGRGRSDGLAQDPGMPRTSPVDRSRSGPAVRDTARGIDGTRPQDAGTASAPHGLDAPPVNPAGGVPPSAAPLAVVTGPDGHTGSEPFLALPAPAVPGITTAHVEAAGATPVRDPFGPSEARAADGSHGPGRVAGGPARAAGTRPADRFAVEERARDGRTPAREEEEGGDAPVSRRVGPSLPEVEAVAGQAARAARNQEQDRLAQNGPVPGPEWGQYCLSMAEHLARELFPNGITTGRVRDDGLTGAGDPARRRLHLPADLWQPVTDLGLLTCDLLAAGPGATAFLVIGRPGRIGHAAVLIHTTDGLVLVNPTTPGHHTLTPLTPTDPARALTNLLPATTDTRALITDPHGHTTTPTHPTTTATATATATATVRVLTDPTHPHTGTHDTRQTAPAENEHRITDDWMARSHMGRRGRTEDLQAVDAAVRAWKTDGSRGWPEDLTSAALANNKRLLTQIGAAVDKWKNGMAAGSRRMEVVTELATYAEKQMTRMDAEWDRRNIPIWSGLRTQPPTDEDHKIAGSFYELDERLKKFFYRIQVPASALEGEGDGPLFKRRDHQEMIATANAHYGRLLKTSLTKIAEQAGLTSELPDSKVREKVYDNPEIMKEYPEIEHIYLKREKTTPALNRDGNHRDESGATPFVTRLLTIGGTQISVHHDVTSPTEWLNTRTTWVQRAVQYVHAAGFSVPDLHIWVPKYVRKISITPGNHKWTAVEEGINWAGAEAFPTHGIIIGELQALPYTANASMHAANIFEEAEVFLIVHEIMHYIADPWLSVDLNFIALKDPLKLHLIENISGYAATGDLACEVMAEYSAGLVFGRPYEREFEPEDAAYLTELNEALGGPLPTSERDENLLPKPLPLDDEKTANLTELVNTRLRRSGQPPVDPDRIVSIHNLLSDYERRLALRQRAALIARKLKRGERANPAGHQ